MDLRREGTCVGVGSQVGAGSGGLAHVGLVSAEVCEEELALVQPLEASAGRRASGKQEILSPT